MFNICAKGIFVIAPKELIDEILKHLNDIARRVGKSDEEIMMILKEHILPKIKVCDISEYKENLKIAIEICKDFDITDAPFLALAIKYDCPIWSNDRDLKGKAECSKSNDNEGINKIFRENAIKLPLIKLYVS